MTFRVGAAIIVSIGVASCGGRTFEQDDVRGVEPPTTTEEPPTAVEEPVACVTGPGNTVIAQSAVVMQPAVDDGDVIVVLDGNITRYRLATGNAQSIGATRSSGPPVVLADRVYFTAGSQTFSVAENGDGMATGVPELVSLRPLMADDSALYLDDYSSTIVRWEPATHSLARLEIGQTLLLNAAAVYGDYVYIAGTDFTSGFTNGVIARIRKLGGSLEVLVANIGHPWSLVASAAGLFWSEDPPGLFDAGPGRVAHSALDGSGVTTLLPAVATSLAFAAGRLYAAQGSEIDSVSATGDDLRVIARDLDDPGMLAITGSNLVFVTPNTKALSSAQPQIVMTTCVAP